MYIDNQMGQAWIPVELLGSLVYLKRHTTENSHLYNEILTVVFHVGLSETLSYVHNILV